MAPATPIRSMSAAIGSTDFRAVVFTLSIPLARRYSTTPRKATPQTAIPIQMASSSIFRAWCGLGRRATPQKGHAVSEG